MRFIGTLVLALSVMPALAADLDCQLGVTGGAVYGRSQHVHSSGYEFTDAFNVNGRAAGVQFGCLAVRDRLRYGAALDLMDTNASGNTQERAPNQDFFADTAFDWIATMRAVGGYQLDPRHAVCYGRARVQRREDSGLRGQWRLRRHLRHELGQRVGRRRRRGHAGPAIAALVAQRRIPRVRIREQGFSGAGALQRPRRRSGSRGAGAARGPELSLLSYSAFAPVSRTTLAHFTSSART